MEGITFELECLGDLMWSDLDPLPGIKRQHVIEWERECMRKALDLCESHSPEEAKKLFEEWRNNKIVAKRLEDKKRHQDFEELARFQHNYARVLRNKKYRNRHNYKLSRKNY